MTSLFTGRVKLVHNSAFKKDGLKQYAQSLRKYNITPTLEGPFTVTKFQTVHPVTRAAHWQHTLVKRVSSGQNGTVPVEDLDHDAFYLAEVDIGTPAQKMLLDFDTGSADLWVWSSHLSKHLRSQGKASGHNIFDPCVSKTWQKAEGTWKIEYGDSSSASGTVGKDVVKIGGTTFAAQTVELADHLSAQFVSSAGDGMLGLSFSSINMVQPKPAHTPIESLPNQIFTAYLGSWRDANEADRGESFYTFGSIDQDIVKGKVIHYTKVDPSHGFWEFPSTSTVINGQTLHISAKNTAMADTGTTLALLDDASVAAVYKSIPGSHYDSKNQGFVFPAHLTEEQLPTIKLAVGDQYIVFQKEDLAYADAGDGMVYGSIQSRGSMPINVFGDAVLKAIYAIFDQGNLRFGFVQREEKEQNLSLPPSDDL